MKRSLLLACLTGVTVLSACGSDDNSANNTSNNPEYVNPNDAVAAANAPLIVNSDSACALDLDCVAGSFCFQGMCAAECNDTIACDAGATCDDRGRCVAAGEALPDVLPGLRIKGTPETVFYVTPGQTEVEVTFDLNSAAPSTGVAYIIKRSDAEGAESVVRRMRAQGNKVTFTLDAGAAASTSANPKAVRVELVSAVGAMTLALVPEQAAAGKYAGDVRIETFGAAGLPIEFEIVTQPAGATLSEADKAFVVLPIEENFLFAPGRGGNLTEAAAELVYDEFTQTWVANFRGAFDLTDGVVLQSPEADQIERQLRLELVVNEAGDVTGQFRDLWTGFYESRSANGVITRENIGFQGAIQASKIGVARDAGAVDLVAALPPANVQALGAPSLAECTTDLSAFAATIDTTDYACTGITSTADFEAATPQAQAECAIAVAASSLGGDTTANQIKTYLNGGDINGQSFATFMAACATGENGTCRPSDDVLCARQLIASAYRNQASDSPLVAPLLQQYLDATREQSLGAQFGSLQSDTETRLQWLKSTDYPAIATAQVRDLNERLLDDWQSKVLDVHFEVLKNQFDTAGLIALSREPEGQEAIDARGELLLAMNQSFRTALESLTIATRRWDVLYTAADKRRQKADYVIGRARDLYVLAGVLRNLNLAGGTGYLSAGIGAGFGALQRELGRLNLPFNQLIYARDAEVAVSTSVDPTVSNQTLLGDLEDKARADIATALSTVSAVVAQEQTEALNGTQLRNRLNNEIDDLKADLVSMCGIPRDCSTAELFESDACRVKVNGGECGFVYERASDVVAANFSAADLAASEGGSALVGILEAANEVRIAQAEVAELHGRLTLKQKQTAAFVVGMQERTDIMKEKYELMAEAFANLAENREADYISTVDTLALASAMRAEGIQDDRDHLALWTGMRIGAEATQMGLEIAALTTGRIAAGLEGAAEDVLIAGDALKDGLPTSAEDIPSAAVRLGIGAAAVNSAAALGAAAFSLETASESLSLASDQVGRAADLTLDTLMADYAIGSDEWEYAITELLEQGDAGALKSQYERENMQEAMKLAMEEREQRLALSREEQELRDRRTDILLEMNKLAGLNLRVAQARLKYVQRVMDYGIVVQRAQMVDAKLNELLTQRQNINLLVGSPSAVFSRTNRIVRAENKLELAKDALMNWLVALEYFAVRPFMDQRVQILLARNPYQLEEIADEMLRLQAACGGATNTFTAELSLREDFLTITSPQTDLDGTVVEPGQVFRDLLTKGYVPIDKRTRYTTDATVGNLLNGGSDVLATTFYVDLTDFANLEATCNAKLASVDLQLVGELGSARPTVSLLYDGTGELRSCQPGIDAYVSQFGPGTTSFGSVTYLRSAGRSISPVAGINEFIDGASNTTLQGLPLSSQYTVLIDKSLGENANLDWTKLEDVRVRVSYTYQDVFAEGQCN